MVKNIAKIMNQKMISGEISTPEQYQEELDKIWATGNFVQIKKDAIRMLDKEIEEARIADKGKPQREKICPLPSLTFRVFVWMTAEMNIRGEVHLSQREISEKLNVNTTSLNLALKFLCDRHYLYYFRKDRKLLVNREIAQICFHNIYYATKLNPLPCSIYVINPVHIKWYHREKYFNDNRKTVRRDSGAAGGRRIGEDNYQSTSPSGHHGVVHEQQPYSREV